MPTLTLILVYQTRIVKAVSLYAVFYKLSKVGIISCLGSKTFIPLKFGSFLTKFSSETYLNRSLIRLMQNISD